MLNDFKVASKILRARLAQTNKIDIRVVDHEDFDRVRYINDIEGQIFCTFRTSIKESPLLLVFAREWEDEDVSHIFAFYVNTRFKIIQPYDRKCFERKLKPGTRLGLDVKCGVVNKPTTFPKPCYLSILLQMAEYVLDLDLVLAYVPHKQLPGQDPSSFFVRTQGIPIPQCCLNNRDTNVLAIMKQMRDRPLKFMDIRIGSSPDRIPVGTDILRIFYLRHLLYGIYHARHQILMVVMPHIGMFAEESDSVIIINELRHSFPSLKLTTILPTRFYSDLESSCDSFDTLRAVFLAIAFPMVTIKLCDVNAVIPYKRPSPLSSQASASKDLSDNANRVMSQALGEHAAPSDPELAVHQSFSSSPDIPDLYQSQNMEQPCEVGDNLETSIMTFEVDDHHGEPLISVETSQLSSQRLSQPLSHVSSQSTIITSQGEIVARVLEYDRNRIIKLGPRADFPKTHALNPIDDPHNEILGNYDFFQAEFRSIAEALELPLVLLPLVDRDDEIMALRQIPDSHRIVILPINLGDYVILILIDRLDLVWAFINPDPESQKLMILFARYQQIMSKSELRLQKYKGHQINISCHFHQGYKLIHLLMSIFCLGRAFKIASSLPKRLVYLEKQFRLYCYSICKQLQFRNAGYNLERGLVKENGYLKIGAYRSQPSPVFFERATSSTNLCLFCDYRGIQLSSHMLMKHGGQARAKLELRRSFESKD